MVILLLPKILMAQDISIKEPPISINKKYSIFIGIGKSNQFPFQSDNIPYQVGISRKVVIGKKINLTNELTFIANPFSDNSLAFLNNYHGPVLDMTDNDSFNYIGLAALPEYQLSNKIIIGAAPSLNFHLPASDFSSYFYPTWRTLSVGGNSYIGITFNDLIVKFRYNINTIDSKKTSTFLGLNIEYRFDL